MLSRCRANQKNDVGLVGSMDKEPRDGIDSIIVVDSTLVDLFSDVNKRLEVDSA